nr:hypothetical protein [Fusobacterium gastrosuis]
MDITKYSIRIRKFLKQEYESEENAEEALKKFKEEGKNIITALNIKYDDRYDVFLDLYAEYKIYSAMGDEKIANIKLENFNKLLKSFSSVISVKKEVQETIKQKGMMIFND